METLAYDSWRRQGSSVLFDADLLAPALHAGALVSLRRALAWADGAGDLPDDGRTVLVGGLDAVLRALGADAGADFLRQRVHPFVLRFQQRRDHQGLVFGFNARPKEFTVDRQDRVAFRLHEGEIPLSHALWAATADIVDIRSGDDDTVTRGYHVRRVS